MTLDEYKDSLNRSKNDAVLIYLSEIRTICKLKTAEERDEAFRLFLLQGLTEEQEESDNMAIDMFLSDKLPSQIQRRQNHDKRIQDGAKGGRPESIDRSKVFELRSKKYTQQQIANELGCHVNSIRNILNTTNNNNQQKPTKTDVGGNGYSPQTAKRENETPVDEIDDPDDLPF